MPIEKKKIIFTKSDSPYNPGDVITVATKMADRYINAGKAIAYSDLGGPVEVVEVVEVVESPEETVDPELAGKTSAEVVPDQKGNKGNTGKKA